MAYTEFKGFKRVFSTNTAYSGATHGDFLYFVRENADDKEGQIWFQGMCYGSCRDSEIDKINTALAGFLTGATPTDVKQYIDDLIGGKDASVTGTSSDGHVTVQVDEADGALTAAIVTTNDIASLSATTTELDAIETAVGLNADGTHKTSTGTYTSAATTIEGEIVALDTKLKEVADQVSDLDAASVSGDSKVVIDVIQEDGQITATAANLTGVKLDGYAVGSDADVAATDTLGEALGKLQGQINAMDKDASAVAGQVVTTVAQADGKVTETKANVKDLQLGGYVKDTAATGDIASADTINAALSKLENKAAAITIANADGSINVTPGATGTDINVNIKSGEKVLAKDGAAGLYTDIKLSGVTPSSTAVKEEYALIGTDGSVLGTNIKIYKDSHIVSIRYITDSADTHYQNLEYTYLDASGDTKVEYIDMSQLVLEQEFASGVAITNHVAHGVVDPASETFLTVGADGFKLSGVQDAITTAYTASTAYTDTRIAALDVTGDTAVAGKYVAAIEETDGVVAVKTRANVSEAVLNNYAKGSDATAVAASDTVNGAISKLENQIDKAKAAATTKVVEGTDAGNNMTITPSTGDDGSVTYTVDLTDVASKAALDAEIAARKAVDGQNGDTYAANTGANYISSATSLNDADVKLDTALKAEENARASQDDVIEASVGLADDGSHVTTSGNYTSSATTVVGEIAALDSALKSVADQVSNLDYTGLTNENTKVVTDVKQENGLVSASATTVGDLVITAITTADTKVEANNNLATIAGRLQGQINAMDLPEVHESGAAIVSVSEADGKVSAETGNVNTDYVVLASALTGSAVTANAGTKESEVLQAIVTALDNADAKSYTGVTSTGNTISVTPTTNGNNIEFLKESPTDATVADGHLGLKQNDSHEWYGVMYWIDEETNNG